MTGISSAWQEKNRLEGMQKDREIQKLALRQLYLKCPIKSFCYYTHDYRSWIPSSQTYIIHVLETKYT